MTSKFTIRIKDVMTYSRMEDCWLAVPAGVQCGGCLCLDALTLPVICGQTLDNFPTPLPHVHSFTTRDLGMYAPVRFVYTYIMYIRYIPYVIFTLYLACSVCLWIFSPWCMQIVSCVAPTASAFKPLRSLS